MFKKLKDKIAEEVKSSPQRIQQFAQAAQAAVSSASSSISDISNNDLFSIADNDTPQNTPQHGPNSQSSPGFLDVNLVNPINSPSSENSLPSNSDINGSLSPLSNANYLTSGNSGLYSSVPVSSNTRHRKLSNSSNASDVSFRLPSYESPGGMYHLQSDLDISASEIEDTGRNIPAQLERVNKEQLYAAYRRANEKYNKYRGRYTDLARHYKNLERENAKARSVLVETQDKALRRISELREQCALEQSAKAHLESSLRLELDERNMKIESLNTKIKLLHSFSQGPQVAVCDVNKNEESELIDNLGSTKNEGAVLEDPLIPIASSLSDQQKTVSDSNDSEKQHSQEIFKLSDKIQKLEKLITKSKEAIKTHKEKNSQLSTEMQLLTKEIEKKSIENDQLKTETNKVDTLTTELYQSREAVSKLKLELENFDAKKGKDISSLSKDLFSANEKITELNNVIDKMKKREEENAISLAENKLSIHKELESKENEIKVLKDTILGASLENKTNEESIKVLKAEMKTLELEKNKLKEELADFNMTKDQLQNLDSKMCEMKSSYSELEEKFSKLQENVKCKDLELKQEIDEKLAMKDRNSFLENRNKQLNDDVSNKNKQIVKLEREITDIKNTDTNIKKNSDLRNEQLVKEIEALKSEYERSVENKQALENQISISNAAVSQLESDLQTLHTERDSLIVEIKDRNTKFDHLLQENTELEERNVNLKGKSAENILLESQVKQLEYKLKSVSETHVSEKACIDEDEMQRKMMEYEEKCRKMYDEKLSQAEILDKEHALTRAELVAKEKIILDLEHSIKDKNELKNKCDELIRENAELENKLKSIENTVAALKKKKDDDENSKVDKLCYEAKLVELDEIIKERNQLKNVYEEIMNENKKFVAKISELNLEIVEMKEINNLNQQLLAEKNVLENKLIQLNDLSKENNDLLIQNQQLVKDNLNYQKDIDERQMEIKKIEEYCEIIKKDKNNLEYSIAQIQSEKINCESKTNDLIRNIQELEKEINSLKEMNSQILAEKKVIEEKNLHMEENDTIKNNEIIADNKTLELKILDLTSKNDVLNTERNEFLVKLEDLQRNITIEQAKCKEYSENNETWQLKLSNILEENNSLHEKCSRLKSEKDSACEKQASLELKVVEFDNLKKKYEETNLEIEFLNMRVSQLDNDLTKIKADNIRISNENKAIQKETNNTITTNNNKLQKLNDEVAKLQIELDKITGDKNELQNHLKMKCCENDELLKKLNSYDEVGGIDGLSSEKMLLSKQISELQEKCINVESSNAKEIERICAEKDALINKCGKLEILCKENEKLLANNSNLLTENENMIVKLHVLEKIEAEYKTLLEEKHDLKSLVSKLTSDIEGLQTHLKKVSNDNSQLNDKIRELETNDGIIQMNSQLDTHTGLSNNVNIIEMQTQLNKLAEANAQLLEELKSSESLHTKIVDLERQNSILIDEKLELQDQINSSIDRQHKLVDSESSFQNPQFDNQNSQSNAELTKLRTQCKELTVVKMDLERRLADLELISRSGDSSIKALEQKNEKLKLTKEKLERRLDETLVSLNHIRTLEENTELEYLRNILYEYLTGPSNNNLVLAKVLSAVVKFDQRQTQIVIEREKEKQGLLGQLGLL